MELSSSDLWTHHLPFYTQKGGEKAKLRYDNDLMKHTATVVRQLVLCVSSYGRSGRTAEVHSCDCPRHSVAEGLHLLLSALVVDCTHLCGETQRLKAREHSGRHQTITEDPPTSCSDDS